MIGSWIIYLEFLLLIQFPSIICDVLTRRSMVIPLGKPKKYRVLE